MAVSAVATEGARRYRRASLDKVTSALVTHSDARPSAFARHPRPCADRTRWEDVRHPAENDRDEYAIGRLGCGGTSSDAGSCRRQS